MPQLGVDLTTRIDEIDSRREIAELVARYCHGLDRRDLDLFLGVWHDDGVWDFGELFGRHEGVEQIRAALANAFFPLFSQMHHLTTNLVVELDGDRASGSSDAYTIVLDASGNRIVAVARYDDSFERRERRWGIVQRRVTIFNLPGA